MFFRHTFWKCVVEKSLHALVSLGSRISYRNVTDHEQNNAVEFELTKKKNGQFTVVRIHQEKPRERKTDNIKHLLAAIKANLQQYHDVMRNLKQSQF